MIPVHNCQIDEKARCRLVGATESGKSVLLMSMLDQGKRTLYVRYRTHLEQLDWKDWPEHIRARVLPAGVPAVDAETVVDPKQDFTPQEVLEHARRCSPCMLLQDDTQGRVATKSERERWVAFRNAVRNEEIGIAETSHCIPSPQERRGLKHLFCFALESKEDEDYADMKFGFPVYAGLRRMGEKHAFAHWNRERGWHYHHPIQKPGWLK